MLQCLFHLQLLTASVIERLLVFVFLLVKGSVEFFGHIIQFYTILKSAPIVLPLLA